MGEAQEVLQRPGEPAVVAQEIQAVREQAGDDQELVPATGLLTKSTPTGGGVPKQAFSQNFCPN